MDKKCRIMRRKPVAADKFYPADKFALLNQIETMTVSTKHKQQALALIVPHAGYVYSGAVAGKVISLVEITDTVLLLGPNHTGLGKLYSLMCSGIWETPLGNVNINQQLANMIVKGSKIIEEDRKAHIYEHCLEVELPFLQYYNPRLNIVPLVVADTQIKRLKEAAQNIANTLKAFSEQVLLVVSTDFSHYEPQEVAKEKDSAAIQAILNLEPEDLFYKVNTLNISMCGFAPVVMLLYICKELGVKKVELIDYQTSGRVSGDYSSVVGYAGIVIR
ncbi:MAG: AmmeMemoRadiSam system protein B [Candidatus Omnitrophota bacterium]|nr:MAG: AmmeMemoRadiSam system protein B [Candidatus Omnitrophota bacterium]